MAMFDREGARTWAFEALELTRGGLGLEQGSDLMMQLVYLRWALSEEGGGEPWGFPFREELMDAPDLDRAQQMFREGLARRVPWFSQVGVLPLTGDGGATFRRATELVTGAFHDLAGDELRRACHLAYEELLRVRTEELGRHGGELSTPSAIAELMCRVLDIHGGAVLDPACGIGTSLLAASSAGPSSLTGWDVNAATVTYAAMRLELAGVRAQLSPRDALVEPWPRQFSAVVLQPPLGMIVSSRQIELMPSLPFGVATPAAADMVWLQLACEALVEGGRASILALRGGLWRKGRERTIRENLLRSGLVEAVIALPPNLLPHTAIPSVVWIVRSSVDRATASKDVLLVDAQGLERPSKRPGKSELPSEAVERLVRLIGHWRERGEVDDAPAYLARAVRAEEIIKRETLLPRQYLEPPPRERPSKPVPARTLLTQVRLRNFKSFGEQQSVDLAPINLIYGPNASGKSSLIQALLLLKQSIAATNLVTEGAHADAGSFLGALHNHSPESDLRLGLTFGALRGWEVAGGTPDPSRLRSVDLQFRADASGLPHQEDVLISISESLRTRCESSSSSSGFRLGLSEAEKLFEALSEGTLLWPYDTRRAREEDDERKRYSRLRTARAVVRHLERAGVSELTLSRVGVLPGSDINIDDALARIEAETSQQANVVRSYAQRAAQVLGAVSAETRLLLDGLVHLGPLRPPPQRFYSRASANSSTGGRTALHLFDNSSEVEEVSTWLQKLGVPYALEVAAVQNVGRASVVGDLVALVLTDVRTQVEVSPVDVGFGVSQVLPIVVELLAQQESIICVEQPETHLHPKLQTELADLFIHSALTPGHENQLLVETHSEHILLRLQRRIREGVISPSDIAVLYVSHDDGRGANVRRLMLDDDGHLRDPWPAGFFDEALDELFGDLL